MAAPARRRPVLLGVFQARMFQRRAATWTYPLLECLVDGIHGILDGDALHVPRSDFQAQREVQVNLLDWWRGQELLEDFLVVNGVGRRVDLPSCFLCLWCESELRALCLCCLLARAVRCAQTRETRGMGADIPRSLMFRTPGCDVEPVLRWPLSLGGDDDRPWTAESTLDNGSDMVVEMVVVEAESAGSENGPPIRGAGVCAMRGGLTPRHGDVSYRAAMAITGDNNEPKQAPTAMVRTTTRILAWIAWRMQTTGPVRRPSRR